MISRHGNVGWADIYANQLSHPLWPFRRLPIFPSTYPGLMNVGASSVIVKSDGSFAALVTVHEALRTCPLYQVSCRSCCQATQAAPPRRPGGCWQLCGAGSHNWLFSKRNKKIYYPRNKMHQNNHNILYVYPRLFFLSFSSWKLKPSCCGLLLFIHDSSWFW